MLGYIFVLIPLLSAADAIDGNEVKLSCPASDEVCEFDFTIMRKQTMLFYDGTLGTPIVSRGGTFYKRPKCDSDSSLQEATPEELTQVIMADGGYRHIHTVNGQYVGPSIIVTEGQEVMVKVTNKLYQESLSMHWHGLRMKNTNWMDGVAGLTQCAIHPHESFTYRFIASPPGTHWYHLHQGNQRSDGAFGAIIVQPKTSKKAPSEPAFEKEFIAVINDYFPLDSNLAFVGFMANQKQFLWDNYNGTAGECYGGGGPAPDGASTATYRFHSGLINGKGRRYDDNGNPYVNTPMETYKVQPNKYYRFRVINSAMTYALRVSVDQHPMVVISSDGHRIEPVEADSVILNPAERFDFYIYTNQSVGKYWIRAQTFEEVPKHVLGVLDYEGSTGDEPTSDKACRISQCVVVNCPFKSFGTFEDAKCVNFEDLKSLEPADKDDGIMDEYIMAFEKTRTVTKKKRNTALGIQFTPPSSPPVVHGHASYDDDCAKMNCGHEPCKCTQQVNLKLGHTIQITMMSNTTHPMHIHGNPFQVVAMGYPEYDPTTFKKKSWSKDIRCNNDLCYNASWTNKDWYNGKIPGINVVNPPVKDSITIPAGGYVVIRFKADNPGWWLVHCHLETHFLQGMALILQVGEDKDMIPPPKGFNKCGSYKLEREEFQEALKRTADEVHDDDDDDEWSKRERRLAYGYIGAILLGLVLGILVHILFVKCTK